MHKYFFINKSCYICLTNFKQNLNMKKIILSVVAVMAFGFANAQDKGGAGLAKGDLVMTGDVGFLSVSNVDGVKDKKSSDLTFSPRVGYMMSDNLMLRGGFDVTSGSTNTGAVGAKDAKTSGFGVNVGATYLFTPADNFSLGLGGRLSYGSGTRPIGDDDFENLGLDKDTPAGAAAIAALAGKEVKTTTTSFRVPLSMHYFVANNWAITSEFAGIGFSSEKGDLDKAEAATTIDATLDMSAITFGVLYKF